MNKICFTSVAFGPQYVEQLDRLRQSLLDVMPEADAILYRDKLPRWSKQHKESLYGFKVHAVNSAIELGYSRIVFLDPACILQRNCNEWFSGVNPPVLAARDDNKLLNFCSLKAWDYFNILPNEDLHLVGGSVYVFDFDREPAIEVFKWWYHAEANGIFGSASEKPAYHRNDETCMALALSVNMLSPMDCDAMGYNTGSNPIILKKHFK